MVKFANNLDKKCTEIYWKLFVFRENNKEDGASIMRLYEITYLYLRTYHGAVRVLKNFFLNQQSEYKLIYELMCWLSGSLTCRLPNVMRSPPAKRSLVSLVTVD